MSRTSKTAARITTRVVAVGMVAGIALAAGGTANAATPAVNQAMTATHGFHVYNYTHQLLTLTSATGFDGDGPAIGTVLYPGDSEDLEVDWEYNEHKGTADYTAEDGQKFEAVFSAQVLYEDGIGYTVPGGYNGSRDWTDNNEGLFLDDNGDEVNLDGTDPAAGELLQHMCNAGVVRCSFNTVSHGYFSTPSHFLTGADNGDPVGTKNPPTQLSVGQSDTAESSDTLGLSVEAGGSLAGLIDVKFTGSFQHTWGQSHTFQTNYSVSVQPQTREEIWGADPMDTLTGNFTAVLNNVTWHVNGATFTSPDPNRSSDYKNIELPLTQVK